MRHFTARSRLQTAAWSNATEMNDEDVLYDSKLLPHDADPSTSRSEIVDCEPANSEFPSAKDAEITEKDVGWAWVVCGAAFCDLFVVLGMHYTVGVLYAALLDHFKDSKANTGTKYFRFVVYRSDLLAHINILSGQSVELSLALQVVHIIK